MNNPLVSIIMPAKDVADYIAVAIDSVLNQTFTNWELIVVENGSSDKTADIVSLYYDTRIKLIRSNKTGLSHARNLGLSEMKGKYVCFLDADDLLPLNSLSSRISYFENHPDVSFVDGTVVTRNYSLNKIIRVWLPSFRGIPDKQMAMMNPSCFCGITWMIKREAIGKTVFDETWTHLEDRLFFLSIAPNGLYNYVADEVYCIRRRSGSLMANLNALEDAYFRFIEVVQARGLLSFSEEKRELRYFHRMFFKTYIKNLQFVRALSHFFGSLTRA